MAQTCGLGHLFFGSEGTVLMLPKHENRPLVSTLVFKNVINLQYVF